jgi:hypothetical protein
MTKIKRRLHAHQGNLMNRLLSTAFAAAITFTLVGTAPAFAETKPKKEPTASQLAARERMTKCSIEWKEAKAGGKLESGAKWPQFWSACNKRLKGGDKA